MGYLRAHEILASFHYVPPHTSPVGRELGFREGSLPATEFISQRLMRLTFLFEITERQQEAIVNLVEEYMRTSVTTESLILNR